jgi:hypothetical protein
MACVAGKLSSLPLCVFLSQHTELVFPLLLTLIEQKAHPCINMTIFLQDTLLVYMYHIENE